MTLQPRYLLIPLLVAGLSFWLLLVGPPQLLGVDTGNLGVALLFAMQGVSLWWITRLPPADLEATAAPAEWQAWIGLVFLGLAVSYFIAKLPVLAVAGPIFEHPDASRVGRNVVALFVAWIVLSSVVKSRWRGRIESDERDQQIAARGSRWAHGTVLILIVMLAVALGFTPTARMPWATPTLIAHLLILAMMLATLVETAVVALSYRQDRRGT